MNNNTKIAFVVCVSGERYIEYRENLEKGLKKYVPDIPVVDIDPKRVIDILSPMKDANAISSAWMAIPQIEDLRTYERVIYLDVDTDIASDRFSKILDVETGNDGIAACYDVEQESRVEAFRSHYPTWDKKSCMNDGVLVMDLCKIDTVSWKSRIEQVMGEYHVDSSEWVGSDVLNLCFDCSELDSRLNWIWSKDPNSGNGAWLVHYAGRSGHEMLNEVLSVREEVGEIKNWKDRCVVVSPRHAFIRPWIRAYFATGNMTPLVIVPGPPGDWKDGDMEYCRNAARFCGGLVFDCSGEWKDSQRLAARAVKRNNVGWFTKKSILHAVAKRLAPKSWAWIDDDAEVTGTLDECFECAEHAPGFIFTQFYYPSSIDNRHPERTYRSNIDTGDKICWNSLIFFHGDANQRIVEELGKDFPVEDDEIVFGHLYQTNKIWHEGFCDYSIRNWQMNCKYLNQIPKHFDGKLLHYTSNRNGGEIKNMWAAKSNTLRKAPFEEDAVTSSKVIREDVDGPIDAVFVIGTGSINGNEELRYALRNLEAHCKFIRDVYICGFCPQWVNKKAVKHLQWPDRFAHAKDANIIDKLRHACEQPGIAKRILFCSDDQFQTHPCTWDDFSPRYLRRYASNDNWYENRRRVWHTRLRKTLEREVQRRHSVGLDANEVFYYQPHIWMPIDRDVFIDYARWCGYDRRDDTIIASGYFNFANVDGKPDFDHVFLAGDTKTKPEATHVAYHDGSYSVAMQILKEMFPNPCRFEAVAEKVAVHDKMPSPTRITVKSAAIEAKSADDPSPATSSEMAEINVFSAHIRRNPLWHNLLGEISRAEELRLFGVRGWRTVWNDIQTRWRMATQNGAEDQKVGNRRSEEAARIVNAYMADPDALRTVCFGSVKNVTVSPTVWSNGRKLQRPAAISDRTSLRERVRASLRN